MPRRVFVSSPRQTFGSLITFLQMTLVVLGESEADLQLALDAVTRWGRQWRVSFGVGPEKSAVMIFGPARSRPSCRVCLIATLALS